MTRGVPASRPVSEMAVGMAKTPKANEISKMIGEFKVRLVMMGAIRGELSFRILAFTSSQPGAFLDGKLARGDGLKHKQGSNVLTGTANRFTRMNSLCASNVEIVFLSKIRGFQSCHFSHIN